MTVSGVAAGAVVVGGDYRGLGIVRSLGRQGVPVRVVHGSDRLAVGSRYCIAAVHVPDGEPDRLIDTLLELAPGATSSERPVLFATSDETAWLVSRHHARLAERYRLTVPEWDVYSAAADKWRVHQAAAAIGLQAPLCWHPHGVAELGDLDIDDAAFPLIVKPTRREARNALTTAKAWRARDRRELVARYRAALDVLPPDQLMLQEWIGGDNSHQLAVAAVCAAGEPRYVVAARRTRQYPREVGRASCFVETIEDPELVKDATRLTTELGIDGLVEVEFKRDAEDGQPKLLDVNVRVWGWHSIGAPAGVDFAHAAYRAALGERLEFRAGKVGVRWSRLAVDLPYAVRDVVTRRMRVRQLTDSLRPPLEGPVSARDDPVPALLELPYLAAGLTRRRGR